MNALVTHQEARAVGAVYSFEEKKQMAECIAQSGLFGVKNATQALALMLVAEAEGEHPASVAQDYDIIQGKGTRKTHSVLARFQAMGGKVDWHELTHTRAEATFSHPKGGSLRMDWTIEQAKQAGLTGKDNWKGYARAMLRARLIAEGVRAVYPAAIGGWQVPEEAMGPQLDAMSPQGPKDMGAADVVQPKVDPALLKTGEEAAAKGRAAYTEFWKACTHLQRAILSEQTEHHERLKKAAADADDKRTVTTGPTPTPTPAPTPAPSPTPAPTAAPTDGAPFQVTFARIAEMMKIALDKKDPVALDVGADWIGELQDQQQRADLMKTYEEYKAAIEGGAS